MSIRREPVVDTKNTLLSSIFKLSLKDEDTGVHVGGRNNVSGAEKVRNLGLWISPAQSLSQNLEGVQRPQGIHPGTGNRRDLKAGLLYRLNRQSGSTGVYATAGDDPTGYMVGIISPNAEPYVGRDDYLAIFTILLSESLGRPAPRQFYSKTVKYAQPISNPYDRSLYSIAARNLYVQLGEEARQFNNFRRTGNEYGMTYSARTAEQRAFSNVWLFYSERPSEGVYLCLGRFRVVQYFRGNASGNNAYLELEMRGNIPDRNNYDRGLRSLTQQQQAQAQTSASRPELADLRELTESAVNLLSNVQMDSQTNLSPSDLDDVGTIVSEAQSRLLSTSS